MTLYGEDFDYATEANDRIGIDYSDAGEPDVGPSSPLYARGRLTQGLRHRCMILFLLKGTMNIMEKAQKRAILMIDSEYVFNDIYFTTEEGMTSTSAQHVSAMANVMVQDIKQHIMGLRLYEKSIRVIGDAEVTVETVNNTLPEIAESVKRICKANALIAWLREAVKEREQAQKYVSDMTLDDWMKKQGIEKPVSPEPPQMPRINFQDYKTILDTGLSVKEYNRFVELNSALAVYGEMIHEKGLLTRQKSELARIMQNPTEVKESGRDTIITTYKVDVNISADIDNLYTELQSEYRKLQAEKNGIEAKFSNLAMDYQTRKNDEWKAAKAQYDRDLQKVNSELVGIQTQMKEWKKQRLEELAALKIIIPDALKPLYKELKVKYL